MITKIQILFFTNIQDSDWLTSEGWDRPSSREARPLETSGARCQSKDSDSGSAHWAGEFA